MKRLKFPQEIHALQLGACVHRTLSILAAGLVFSTSLFGQQPAPAPPVQSRTYESLTTAPQADPLVVARPLIARKDDGGLLVARREGVFVGPADGKTWRRVGSIPYAGPGDFPVGFVATAPDGARCLTRSGQVLESVDGGATWRVLARLDAFADRPGAQGSVVASGQLRGDGGGWAVIRSGVTPRMVSRVLVSQNSVDWTLGCDIRGAVTAASRGEDAIYAISGTDVYEISLDGKSCNRISSLQGAQLNGLAFVDGDHGWIAADQGLMIETKDGGRSWLPRPVAPGTVVETVGFLTSGGWAIAREGGLGIVLMTSDGGVTWKRVMTGAPPISALTLDGVGWAWLVDGAGEVWAAEVSDWKWRRLASMDGKSALGPAPALGPRQEHPGVDGQGPSKVEKKVEKKGRKRKKPDGSDER